MQFNRDEKGVMQAAASQCGYRYGLGTYFCRSSGCSFELRNRLVPEPMKAVIDEVKAAGAEDFDPNSPSVKVIADHIRACTFIIADGVVPGNEGPQLRSSPYRSPRYASRLQARRPQTLLQQTGLRPLLKKWATSTLKSIIPIFRKSCVRKEVRFSQTLSKGLDILNEAWLPAPRSWAAT